MVCGVVCGDDFWDPQFFEFLIDLLIHPTKFIEVDGVQYLQYLPGTGTVLEYLIPYSSTWYSTRTGTVSFVKPQDIRHHRRHHHHNQMSEHQRKRQ